MFLSQLNNGANIQQKASDAGSQILCQVLVRTAVESTFYRSFFGWHNSDHRQFRHRVPHPGRRPLRRPERGPKVQSLAAVTLVRHVVSHDAISQDHRGAQAENTASLKRDTG